MNQDSRRRVGIMGGTFDPIHIGHLMIAERAYEQFELDTVLFLPNKNPPHKKECIKGDSMLSGRVCPDGATDRQRMEMVSLAIEDNPHFELDAAEMVRQGYSYTSDTLRLLKQTHPDTDYYFIIGADSLMTLDTWKDPQAICRDCILLVGVRDQFAPEAMRQKMEELKERYGAEIALLHSPNLEISSHILRSWCRQRRSIRYFVPDCVLDYIEKNHVYTRDL